MRPHPEMSGLSRRWLVTTRLLSLSCGLANVPPPPMWIKPSRTSTPTSHSARSRSLGPWFPAGLELFLGSACRPEPFDGHRKTARIEEAVTQLRIARARVADEEQTLFLALMNAVTQRQSARNTWKSRS